MTLKHLIGHTGAVVCLAAWTAVGVGYLLHVGVTTWTVLVVIAAVSSEALIWCLAAMLGLSVFEARRAIWRMLTRPFRKAA